MDIRTLGVKLNCVSECYKKKPLEVAKEFVADLNRWLAENDVQYSFLIQLINENILNKNILHALSLLQCQRIILLQTHKHEDGLPGYEACVWKLKLVFQNLQHTKHSYLCESVVLPDMFSICQHAKKAFDNTQVGDALNLCKCLLYTGVCLASIKAWEKCMELYEEACSLFNKGLDSEENSYRVFGYCLNNLGTCYANLGESDKAIVSWKQAAIAFAHAKDWSGESKKEYFVEQVSNNIRKLKYK